MSNISLLGKWLKSENTSSKESRRIAEIIRSGLGMTPKQYRQMLSKLRKRIDVVERKMSSKEWNSIDYQTVPSQAGIKYKNAFLRNDEERYTAYLESVKKGETKINAATLQPHEIVRKYLHRGYYSWECSVTPYNETLEQLWKALPHVTIDNTLVVRDGSGSMLDGNPTARPLDVATALAICMAGNNTGIWKDKFITFSKRPKLIDLSNCENLHDMLVETYTHDECENTNIEATMMLVLDTAVKNHCTQEEMPKRIVICSDMQFDFCVRSSDHTPADATLFEEIAARYEEAGYLMPKICFWNLSGIVNGTIPLQQNKLGVVLMSGFSVQLLNMVMSGETDPYKVVLETINSERYEPIQKALEERV